MTHRRFTHNCSWITFALLMITGSIFLFFCSGYRFSGLFFIGLAPCIPIYHLISAISNLRWRKVLHMIELLFLSILFIAMAITSIPIVKSSKGTQHPDSRYIIILGAGVYGNQPSLSLRIRLNTALNYMATHPDTIAIVSGGQGNGEDISEAECMYHYLSQAGISENRIWKEERSTSTRENILFSLNLIEQKTGIRPGKAGIISSDYHLYRASLFAHNLNLETDLIPATTTKFSLRLNYYLREIFAVWYYSITGGF